MLKKILPEGLSKPSAPYSYAVKVGQLIFTSGLISIDLKTGQPLPGSIEEETKRVLENLRAILEGYGASLNNVVKTTVFLRSINDFSAFNEVYGSYFKETPPARATVQAVLAGKYVVEIAAIAIQD